jgi:hypothetical protein
MNDPKEPGAFLAGETGEFGAGTAGKCDPPPTWRRKTAEEQQRDWRAARWARFNPAGPLLIGAIAGSVGAVITAIASFQSGFEPAMIVVILGVSLAFALLTGAFFYVLQVLGGLPPPRRVRMGICDRCFRLTLDGTLDACECGGRYEDVHGWKLNHCPKCGYDLRGSGDRCPECGASVRPGDHRDYPSARAQRKG